jgi:hypothetical protein
MVVPPIGFDSITIAPFTNRTRLRMLIRPKPLPANAASTFVAFTQITDEEVNLSGIHPQLHFSLPYSAVLDNVVQGFL